MAVLSADKLPGVWERGLIQSPAERALTLLHAASDDPAGEGLAQLSIGKREARLLDFHQQAFGGTFKAIADCPGCDERLELNFTARDVRLESEHETPSMLAIERDSWVVTSEHAGGQISAAELPAEVVDAIAAKMAATDPQADIEVALKCPACSHRWRTPFDVASFFWNELNVWAIRLLREVHALACAYGWTLFSMSSVPLGP
jgi:hypothetical protein